MVRKKSLSELEHAEIKLQTLLEKRGLRNEEAKVLREERDLVHAKKRELATELRALRDRRAAHVAEAREHRATRDESQAKAKSLIEMKRKLRGKAGTSAGKELRAVKRRIAQLEMEQQTATLSLKDEGRLLEELKAKINEAQGLETLKAEEDKVVREVRDLDAAIAELFAVADREHAASVEASGRARAFDADITALRSAISSLALEGNQKHEAYLEAKAKADEVHAKVVAMREKVLTVRAERRAERRESRELLREQNRGVRRALHDEKKLEETADEALKVLLQRGKVEIGR